MLSRHASVESNTCRLPALSKVSLPKGHAFPECRNRGRTIELTGPPARPYASPWVFAPVTQGRMHSAVLLEPRPSLLRRTRSPRRAAMSPGHHGVDRSAGARAGCDGRAAGRAADRGPAEDSAAAVEAGDDRARGSGAGVTGCGADRVAAGAGVRLSVSARTMARARCAPAVLAPVVRCEVLGLAISVPFPHVHPTWRGWAGSRNGRRARTSGFRPGVTESQRLRREETCCVGSRHCCVAE